MNMARITASLAVISIALLIMLLPGMEAAQYIVGDDQGWNSDVDYYSWMDGKTFHVGDSLVFNYVSGEHNVVAAANYDVYDKCGTRPNLGVWTSGSDVLTLPTTGTYYFLCAYHCDYTEQRIMVVVDN